MDKKMKKVFVGFLAFVLCSCGDSSSQASFEPVDILPDESHAGMMLVKAAGKSTVLGSNRFSKTDEFPEMKVLFSYDFSIGEHEVTCDEYNSQASHPQKCSGNVPVTNVTYFDAALFANEKSKAEGLDTAYEYASAVFSEAGNCTDLGGFAFHPERNAYRLPTEAEWILVASQDFRQSVSWNADNSDYQLHSVCSVPDKSEICDMAGNAMEWVNDWKGKFRDTVLVNFVGGSDGGSLGERVLKGGSFRNAPGAMTPYSRGDVYAVTSSTFADYVGFRLALGKIPDAIYLDKNGQASDSPVRIKASSYDLKNRLGSLRAKLVFRKDESGNLAFVNYWNASLSVTEIPDTLDAYHPAISPDGKRVAFCTRPEGISGRSDLYVRDLDAKGSNLVKLDAESAAIPRWRVVGADTQIVYVTGAGNNSDAAEWKLGSTWAVPFSGGKFGTPEKLFDGTYNGGVSADGRLAVSGARLLRANADGKESVWYSGEQACNASLSDTAKRTLFLDFGGETGKSFAGKSYDAHEMLLVADSSGKLSEMVPSPAGYAFDHTEWVRGRESLAVATLTDAGGAHSKIALVNLSDSSVLELAEGRELWHPDLWVANTSSQNIELDLDSAGVYYAPDSRNPMNGYSVELAIRLQNFWKNHQKIEAVSLGSSMLLDAIIEDSVKTYNLIHMEVPMGGPYLMEYLLEHYILPYASNLKVIVVEFSPGLLFRDHSYLNSLRLCSPGILYDENHLNSKSKDLIVELSERVEYPQDIFVQSYIPGTFLLYPGTWQNTEVAVDTTTMLLGDITQKSLAVYRRIKNIADSLGVKIVAVMPPHNSAYRNTGAYSLFGPSRTVAHMLIDSLASMEYVILDENRDGLHDYADPEANNSAHLSILGAAKLTARLDSLLRTLK